MLSCLVSALAGRNRGSAGGPADHDDCHFAKSILYPARHNWNRRQRRSSW